MDENALKAIKEALAILNPYLDDLPEDAKVAVETLAALAGYGSVKGGLSPEDAQAGITALSALVDESGLLSAEEIRLLKVLERYGYPYAYGYGYGYPTAREETTQRAITESIELGEPVEGSEGLEWKVSLIKAGLSANYKYYPAELLEASVKKFEGLQAFEDHGYDINMLSVKDICGWYTDAAWDPERQAIVATYHALESAESTKKIKEAWERGKRDLTGFSIRAVGAGYLKEFEGKQVWWIEELDPLSVDIVAVPAAGGEFLEELTEARYMKEFQLLESLQNAQAAQDAQDAEPAEPSEPDEPAEPEDVTDDDRSDDMPEGVVELLETLSNKLKLMECESLLTKKLAESELPEAVTKPIREEFAGKIFEEKTSTVRVTFDSKDKIAKGIEGMILGEMVDGVQPFRSIFQAYSVYHNINPYDVPKDYMARLIVNELRSGYDSSAREYMALQESVSFPVLLGDAMHKRLLAEYKMIGYDDWRKIVSEILPLEDLNDQKPSQIGFLGPLPKVLKLGNYQSLGDFNEQAVSWTPEKRGGTVAWAWEDALSDNLNALRRIPRILARALSSTCSSRTRKWPMIIMHCSLRLTRIWVLAPCLQRRFRLLSWR